MTAKKRDIVIAGYSETAIDFKTGRSAYDLGGEALAKLLAATGIEKDAIDGLSVTTPLKTLLAPPEPRVAVKLARLRVPAPPRVARASLSPRVRLAPPAMVTLDEAAKVEPFIRERKVSFPVLLDPGRKVNEMFVVEGIPKSFVYDREGKLVAQSIDMRTQKQFLGMLAKAGLD